jgi:hypothetical protein
VCVPICITNAFLNGGDSATVSDDLDSRVDDDDNEEEEFLPKLLCRSSESKKEKQFVVFTVEFNVVHIIRRDLDSPTLIHRSPDGMFLIAFCVSL